MQTNYAHRLCLVVKRLGLWHDRIRLIRASAHRPPRGAVVFFPPVEGRRTNVRRGGLFSGQTKFPSGKRGGATRRGVGQLACRVQITSQSEFPASGGVIFPDCQVMAAPFPAMTMGLRTQLDTLSLRAHATQSSKRAPGAAHPAKL